MSDDRSERRGGDRPRGGAGGSRPDRQGTGRGRTDRAGRGDRGGEGGRDDRQGGYRGRDDRQGGDRRQDDRQGGYRSRDDRQGGDRRQDRPDRPLRTREPEVPEGIEAGQLDKALRAELLTLSKDNAEGTARHLVAVGLALEEEDFDAALAHAQAAAKRAGRVAGVREMLGVVHYRRGEWAKALAEFRTARRLSGLDHLLPLMADTERGLGRPERALDLASGPEVARLAPAERVEMAIVVSGARVDLGQTAAAVQHLRDLARAGSPKAPWAARLRYAYAAALEADGQDAEAREWYARAAEVDTAGETDAAEILGVEVEPELIDLGGLEDDTSAEGAPGDRQDPSADAEPSAAEASRERGSSRRDDRSPRTAHPRERGGRGRER